MNIRLYVYFCWWHHVIYGGDIPFSSRNPKPGPCQPRDCVDLFCYRISVGRDGPHTLYPGFFNKITVACDQVTTRGLWTVLMRRVDGNLSFHQSWQNYTKGFGDFGNGLTNLWIGVDPWYTLSFIGASRYRIELFTHSGKSCVAETSFSYLLGGTQFYMITFRQAFSPIRSPDISSSIKEHNNQRFYLDNVRRDPLGCSNRYTGGWWYHRGSCNHFYLTGDYIDKAGVNPKGMFCSACHNGELLKSAVWLVKPEVLKRPCRNPCQMGGTCRWVDDLHTYKCECPPTHCGMRCEFFNHCKNDGACNYNRHTKKNDCRCRATNCGPACEYHCENGGTCKYLAANQTYECICPAPLCGQRCEKMGHCQNNAQCTYSNEYSEDRCICTDTSTCGPKCEFACKNGGTCVYAPDESTYSCVCPDTHCGATCEVTNRCEQNVTCEYPPTTTHGLCDCPATHCGATCENENTCENNGTCEYNALTKTDSCMCVDGFAGPNCTLRTGEGVEVEQVVTQEASSSNFLLPISLFFLVVILGTIMFMCMMLEKKNQDQKTKEKFEERERLLADQGQEDDGNAGFTSWFGF